MIDYSKWDHIELSDDEDDTHPNIDTASLNKWRHEARMARMAEDLQEKKDFEKLKTELEGKKYLLEQKKIDCEHIGDKGAEEDLLHLETEIKADERAAKIIEEKIKTKDRLTPLNVDTISHPGFSKSMINIKKMPSEQELSEEEKSEEYIVFVAENEALLKELGFLHKYGDTKEFLTSHPHLISEHTANYLTMICLEMTLLENYELANLISFQCVTLQFLFEMAIVLNADPKACVDRFFTQLILSTSGSNPELTLAFNKELKNFRCRVTKRAQEKLVEAEEEERIERLGPGGLDPTEVFESLPQSLKRCFEEKNIEMLQEVMKEMDLDEAEYHMARCVDSGLWVPLTDEKNDEVKGDEDENPEEDGKHKDVSSGKEILGADTVIDEKSGVAEDTCIQ